MRDTTALGSRRGTRALAATVLLAGALAGPATAAAQWTLRVEPTTGGTAARCSMASDRQELPDGYQNTWAQIVVDRQVVRVTSASQLDPGDGDMGLVVDDGQFIKVDEVVDSRTALFRTQYNLLVEDDAAKRAAFLRAMDEA
jgi:hypothetical protein